MISIIVPVYKVEPYLPKCIESIINQTYHDLEIILVDDGSPDQCGVICEEYAKKDNRIRVFHTENKGLSAARNYGIERACGEYIGFVDSDDWIEPNMYEVLLKTAKESCSEIVQCGYFRDSFSTSTISHVTMERTYTSIEALQALIQGEISPGVWNKLWKKECFARILFPEGHVFEEIATVYKLFDSIRTVTSVSRELYHYVRREGSIVTSHSMDNLIDFWIAHKEQYEYFSNDVRFNSNALLINKLLYNCAGSIARTMRWLYGVPLQEREVYAFQLKEMHSFYKQHLQNLDKKTWPIHLRLCILLKKIV